MTTISNKTFIQEIKSNAKKKEIKYCFIIGSGCSSSCGFPTGKMLAEQWFCELLSECPEWKDCPKSLQSALTDADYSNESFKLILNVLERTPEMFHALISSSMPDPDQRPEFKDLIRMRLVNEVKSSYGTLASWKFKNEKEIADYFSLINRNCGGISSKGYLALANLLLRSRHNLVISTNFDTLLQDNINKIRTSENGTDGGRYFDEPIIMTRVDTTIRCMGDGRFHQDNEEAYIFKLHHGLQNVELLNLPYQTRYLPEETYRFLDSVFEQYCPIVLGYSGTDIAFMDYLARTNVLKNRKMFWLKRNPMDISYPVRRVLENVGRYGCIVKVNGFDECMVEITNSLYEDTHQLQSNQGDFFIENNQQDNRINIKEAKKVNTDQEKRQHTVDFSTEKQHRKNLPYGELLRQLIELSKTR